MTLISPSQRCTTPSRAPSKYIDNECFYCPSGFPAGYFWYGKRRHGLERPFKWVQKLLEKGPSDRPEKECVEEQEEQPKDEDPDDDSLQEQYKVADNGPLPKDVADACQEQPQAGGKDMASLQDSPGESRGRTLSSGYFLRRNVVPPTRLMIVSSGQAETEEGVMLQS